MFSSALVEKEKLNQKKNGSFSPINYFEMVFKATKQKTGTGD